MKRTRRLIPCLLLAGGVIALTAPAARADAVKGTLFYTTFAGGQNVWSVGFDFDGTTLSLASSVNLASTNGADGLLFDPSTPNSLLVGGQSQNNLAQVSTSGGITGNVQVGSAGQSYHLAVTPGGASVWNLPNGGSAFILHRVVPLRDERHLVPGDGR